MNLYKYLCAFLTLVTFILFVMYHFVKESNNQLLTENKELSDGLKTYKRQLEKEHNDKMELDKQYKKLEAKAKSDKDFNWYADISNSPVVIELHD